VNAKHTADPLAPASETMLSVVIPAFDEQDAIGDIVQRVLALKPALSDVGVTGLELIVVDDGSTDGTAEIAASCDGLRLVRHASNLGYGAAIKTGFAAASGDLVAFIDADGTYPPESFPALCVHALDGADLVVGSRRSGEKSRMPLVRRVGNFFWSGLVSLLGQRHVADPASGMRVIRRSALAGLSPLPDGLCFAAVMSTRAVHERLAMVEVPIVYDQRTGRSKLSVLRDGARFLQTILWTSFIYNPARILGGLGLGAMGLGLAIAATLVGMRLCGIAELGPRGVASTFLAVVLGVFGVDMVALGSTFNYFVALFHKTPTSQGLFARPILRSSADRHLWWVGAMTLIVGLAFCLLSLGLGMNGWPIDRLWLYLLAGTMLVLVGIQLVLFWVIMRVLKELSQRELAGWPPPEGEP
jgi:hypothetical protein